MKKQKKIVLFDIDYTIFDTDTFKSSDLTKFQLYQEVHDVLNELKEVADLGIFSQGEVAFQKKKLSETNIEEYFLHEHVHIVEDKPTVTGSIMDRYDMSGVLFLVDDRLPVLYLAKLHRPSLQAIWVKRGFYAERQKPIENFEPDKTVLDLHDIVPFIKNY